MEEEGGGVERERGGAGSRGGALCGACTIALTRTLGSLLAWLSARPSGSSAWENDGKVGPAAPHPRVHDRSSLRALRGLTGDGGQELPRVGLCALRPRWHLGRA